VERPYFALFERGSAWSLPATSEPGGAKGTVSCKVDDVKPVGDANVSRVVCEPPFKGLLVVGTWVATPAGLYHPPLPVDDADELALLGEDDLLITVKPKEREHSHALGHADESNEAFAFEGSWCVRNKMTSGEERRSYTLCFGDGRVTGGGEVVGSGGNTQRVSFGRNPPASDTEVETQTETEPE
jgi:hypothetical protein